ncbi:unnamed protein product [Paramecium sonneborni]|uniref:Uncharacterized protein n=1 Tax=Paramecium sonneborni TaxID=65129 RepID=A0A8S1RM43_9CILI|nr:unnamed protein product [Paramecium sonneborni]
MIWSLNQMLRIKTDHQLYFGDEAIKETKQQYPNTLFLAEVYWSKILDQQAALDIGKVRPYYQIQMYKVQSYEINLHLIRIMMNQQLLQIYWQRHYIFYRCFNELFYS